MGFDGEKRKARAWQRLSKKNDELQAEVEQLREVLGKCHDYFNGQRRDELPQIIVECKRALGR